MASVLALATTSQPAYSADEAARFSAANGIMTYTAAPGASNAVSVYTEEVAIVIGDGGDDLFNGLPLQRDISRTMRCWVEHDPPAHLFRCDASDVTRVVVNTRNMADQVATVDDEHIQGGPGVPTEVHLGSGADEFGVLGVSKEVDTVTGGRGNDRISTGRGADAIYGNSGADELRGEAAGDVVKGGSGLDVLHGGAGDDLLLSRDSLTEDVFGGLGADRARADKSDRVFNARRA